MDFAKIGFCPISDEPFGFGRKKIVCETFSIPPISVQNFSEIGEMPVNHPDILTAVPLNVKNSTKKLGLLKKLGGPEQNRGYVKK